MAEENETIRLSVNATTSSSTCLLPDQVGVAVFAGEAAAAFERLQRNREAMTLLTDAIRQQHAAPKK